MEFTLENRYLKVTVTTWGAQVKSVVRKSDGVEHMWQADKSVWGYHAPILFPYAGKLKDGIMEVDGVTYHPPGQHGFARTSEHRFVRQSEDTVVLELTDSEETLKVFPWKFRLLSTFRLENDTLHHTLTVENRDERPLSFGIGYHPAFTIPFDSQHTFSDYEFRFDCPQSPLCLNQQPGGLLQGDTYYLATNTDTIPIDENLFSNDSHCMVGLTAKTLGIVALGLTAFAFATVGGILLGKLLYIVTGGKINPLIGSAGVSAVPMAARVAQNVGKEADPTNFLLMHAMGPNVAGVIGSAIAAGFLLSVFG